MQRWIRCEHEGRVRFGTLQDDTIVFCEGDMFNSPTATTETAPLSAVELLTPTEPTKMIALWNNYHALAAKLNLAAPSDPLYFIKASSSFHPGGQPIRRPNSYDGKVVYEGELGIVIGRRCKEVSEAEAPDYIFGYTCINDVTAIEIINKDDSFAQWSRAKSFDTFGIFGPVVATGLDPAGLSVKTHLDGQERQNSVRAGNTEQGQRFRFQADCGDWRHQQRQHRRRGARWSGLLLRRQRGDLCRRP